MQSQSISQAPADRSGAFCKFIDSEAYESKMLAATELENLLKGSKYLRWMLSVEKRLNQLATQVARGIFRNSSVIRSAGIEDRVLCDKSALSVLQWNVDSSAFPQRTMRRNDGFILLMLTAEALGYNAREYGFCTENLVKYI